MALAAAACCKNTGSGAVSWRAEDSGGRAAVRQESPRPHPGAFPAESEQIPTGEDLGLQFAGLFEGRYQQLHKALEQLRAHVVVDQVLDQSYGWGRTEAMGRPAAPTLYSPTKEAKSPLNQTSSPFSHPLQRPFLAPSTDQHCARQRGSWAGYTSDLPSWSLWLGGGRRDGDCPSSQNQSFVGMEGIDGDSYQEGSVCQSRRPALGLEESGLMEEERAVSSKGDQDGGKQGVKGIEQVGVGCVAENEVHSSFSDKPLLSPSLPRLCAKSFLYCVPLKLTITK